MSGPGIKFYSFFNNYVFHACKVRLEIKTEKIKIVLHNRAEEFGVLKGSLGRRNEEEKEGGSKEWERLGCCLVWP